MGSDVFSSWTQSNSKCLDKIDPIFVFCSLQKKSHGTVLLEQVFYNLDIVEKDYFGLQYTDHYNVNVSMLCDQFKNSKTCFDLY